MTSDLKGKVILITGASSGIGEEAAYRFSREGCKLVLTYNKGEAAAMSVAEKCRDLGAAEIIVLHLDVSLDKSIKDCVRKSIEKFRKIDILINNAGILGWKPFSEQTFEEIESESRINLEGLMKMTREALPYINDAIINISSGAGKSGYPGGSVYSATKFGVRGFTQSLALERTDLLVVSVNPGTTSTRMTDFAGVPVEKVGQTILDVAKGKIKPDEHSDVDVWKHI